jgi:nucleolar protein 58
MSMLVLFETPGGYALFKLLDEGKLASADSLWEHFQTPELAAKVVKLKAFSKFQDTATAVAAATAIQNSTLDKSLSKFLKKECEGEQSRLAIIDKKLGIQIKEKLGIKCIHDNSISELMRGIRTQIESLLTGMPESDLRAMKLGLSHSMARYKLKFSPEKVDVMIIQAIALLDELDKELNTYSMRVREWYGWHFPEMAKIVTDNTMFAKTVKKVGFRTNFATTDLSDILPEDVEHAVKEAAEVSMGTEVSKDDIDNISDLCDQVANISVYRTQLFDYLKNRMMAIAPNLTCIVGELVGARLIAHAGSLMSLAKHPASTVQILGAEKALFRALKTKHDTPKYGLIYHASLVGQAAPKFKGKISRVLAAKTSLSARMDALGDSEGVTVGLEHRLKVENRLRRLEGGVPTKISGQGNNSSSSSSSSGNNTKTPQRHEPAKNVPTYNDSRDVVMAAPAEAAAEDKDKKKKKKKAKVKEEEAAAAARPAPTPAAEPPSEKKKGKRYFEEAAGAGEKKKKKKKTEES